MGGTQRRCVQVPPREEIPSLTVIGRVSESDLCACLGNTVVDRTHVSESEVCQFEQVISFRTSVFFLEKWV